MQITKTLIALSVAAGFASGAFAQGAVQPATPAAPAAKISAPAPAAVEKKVEAAKSVAPAVEKKVEAVKAVEPLKAEVAKPEAVKADAGKPAAPAEKAKGHEKHAAKSAEKQLEKQAEKAEAKAEVKRPAPVAAVVPAPTK